MLKSDFLQIIFEKTRAAAGEGAAIFSALLSTVHLLYSLA
jgi:hypothetical protein